MGKKLYVGNLSYSTNDGSLKDAFSACGTVESATIIMDKMSGRSKGFGFVEMSSDEEATAAVAEMNGKEVDGRPIRVSEARAPEARPRSGGYGHSDSGSRGGYGRSDSGSTGGWRSRE